MCALFLFQAAGWQLAWLAARSDARTQAFYHIEHHKDKLLTLTLPSAELVAIRVGKREIRFQNRLYDIHAELVCADSTRLEIYPDTFEDALIGSLGALLSPDRSHSHSTPVQTLLAQWLGLVYLMPNDDALHVLMAFAAQLDSFGFAMPPLAGYASCFSPPPEV